MSSSPQTAAPDAAASTAPAVTPADVPAAAPSPSPAFPSHRPIQIVSISGPPTFKFTLDEAAFRSILDKCDQNHKVSVVSVVGAFRTGKSFLLTWFRHYLESLNKSEEAPVGTTELNCVSEASDDDAPVLVEESDAVPEKEKHLWFRSVSRVGSDETSFRWRGGSERETTGIWMYSEPYPVTLSSGETISVLLVDTQGMFDHETTMDLTAAIFGLSTLISSHQVYNVEKRVQEDHLQQLALFSEYGRLALDIERKESCRRLDVGDSDSDGTDDKKKPKKKKRASILKTKPFQRIEFLVRDWQNFDEDDLDDLDIPALTSSMSSYLESVLMEPAGQSDLADTRRQIEACFVETKCFLLPHPGIAVTKKKFDGTVANIDPSFLALLDEYCQRVFDPSSLEPKMINGRALNPASFTNYVTCYAKMFEDGARFPSAKTVLAATAEANVANAVYASIERYNSEMDTFAGPSVSHFAAAGEFEAFHEACRDATLEFYAATADFGPPDTIKAGRERVETHIETGKEMYEGLNASRDPLKGLGAIALPVTVAVVSYFLRFTTDVTCSSWSETCSLASEKLSHIYTVVIIFLLIIASTKFHLMKQHFGRFMDIALAMSGANAGSSQGTGTGIEMKAVPPKKAGNLRGFASKQKDD
mmetsp:Transcript_37072/g.86486  ORF Transcript_37072/g.86486 Transcript_37072/m.86486 type:complete len:646 (-) Transcript_37072:406-2343(-)|eukprot:CAMPEP_0113303624 /NCGR_PEP_ID=MMETSP0010_2-20120614/3963_1 /TAXON_ID=216773 ORGANISM="Corethron hystrix, Strain 308" /NCGR_SAMPLE_ID=MMETSP0010_2 /ASSEMBLY_ACC=CAM_ASM_000155 /LENGTH=645 /DNA_ID=CAMNT_0000157653 /DNA_START=49 /DNA_END=1986 /DNA_ORIENTATION=+ /assembly_acc=CAM_ASM_000155